MQFKLNNKSEAGKVAHWEANVSFSVRQGWTIKCHPKTYSSGSLLKHSAIPKVLNFLPAYYKVLWLCQWDSLQCQEEDTCAPRHHLHTWDSAVLWLAKCIWINLHPSNGFWVLDQFIQHFYALWHRGTSCCTPRLHPHQSFSSDSGACFCPTRLFWSMLC